MTKYSWTGFMICLVALFSEFVYCLANNSGHSGISPFAGSVFFIPFFLFGILILIKSRGRMLSAWLLSIIGISGMGFGVFVHTMKIMQEYKYWLKAGLHAPNPNATLLLVCYALGVVLLFGITLGKSGRINVSKNRITKS